MLTLWRLGVVPPGDFHTATQPAQYRSLVFIAPMRFNMAGDAFSNILANLLKPRPVVWRILTKCRPQPRLGCLIFEQGIWGAVSFWKTDYTTRKPDQEMLGNARSLGQAITLG